MSNKTLLLIILSITISFKLLATTFQIIPLEQLIEESSSGAEVELKSKRTYKNKLGMIVTDFSFKVVEGFNLSDSDMDDDVIVITMSGGTLDGVTSYIDSAPEFDVGEKSFLLLKKIESKFYLSNFTMGKYKLELLDGQTFYVSSVFPFDADLGRVKKERMVELMRLKFKFSSAVNSVLLRPKKLSFEKTIPIKMARLEERKPAQVYEDKSQDSCVAMWGFLALFSISGLIIWWKLKKGVSV